MTSSYLTGIVAVSVSLAGAAFAMQSPPKKAYLIGRIDVHDAEKFGAYQAKSPGVIEQFGGRFIARGGRTIALEGLLGPGRVVIIEFPSFEAAQNFYNSPAYTAIRTLRNGNATANFVLVEGQ